MPDQQLYLFTKIIRMYWPWAATAIVMLVTAFAFYNFIMPFGLSYSPLISYRITVHVPASHVEQVKEAMFESGAGRIGNYERCAWQTIGQGQFRPLSNSQPFVGQQGIVEIVPEYSVTMVCEKRLIHKVIQALKAVHPYEEASYYISKVERLS